MANRSLGLLGIFVMVATGAAIQPSCAVRQQGADGSPDEASGSELLQRARESPSPERYRRVFERFGSTRAAVVAKKELADLLLSRAHDALEAHDFQRADDAADEARIYGNEAQTQQAEAWLDAIDDGRAAAISGSVQELSTAEGGCIKACAAVVGPLTAKPRPRPRFKEALRRLATPSLLSCLGIEVELRFKEGDGREAKALLVTPEVTVALAKDAYEKAVARLTELVVTRTLEELGPPIRDKKWAEVFAEVDKRHDAGLLEDREADKLRATLLERVHADVLQRIDAARVAQRTVHDAPGIRDLVTLAAWETVPEDIAHGLQMLARSMECERLHCELEKPSQVFAWGALLIAPPDAAGGASASHLEHGQAVYRVARSGTRALISTNDPGAIGGPALLDVASGWVDAGKLRPAPTVDLLPPPELLSGVRVWGPLRKDPHEYSLGVVTAADPKKATVRRLADSLETTVDTRLLRLGTVSPGMKVLAYCVDQMHAEPAKVDGAVVVERDGEKVPVVCERGALAHIEMLSALGADPATLPFRKP